MRGGLIVGFLLKLMGFILVNFKYYFENLFYSDSLMFFIVYKFLDNILRKKGIIY